MNNQNNNNDDDVEYDEMDLTPYEEDDDATLHQKFCAAKVARKRAEEDLKLLCNRIGLLKMEEGKVVKKIDETRKRAGQIVSQRQRNVNAQQAKEDRMRQQQMEEAHRRQQNLMRKQNTTETVMNSKLTSQQRQKQTAMETKAEKEAVRQRNEDQKRQELQRANNMKNMINA